jgi:hypothetical protein
MDEMPTLRQLFVCEKLIFEQGSGNVSLINCHSTRIVDRIPSLPAQFVVYGRMSDGHGTFAMELRIVRLDTGDEIYQRTIPMLLTDRLREAHVLFRVENLVFPAETRYEFDLLVNGELIGMTVIAVSRR